MENKKRITYCENCLKPLYKVRDEEGTFIYESNVRQYKGHWSCDDCIETITERVNTDRKRGIYH